MKSKISTWLTILLLASGLTAFGIVLIGSVPAVGLNMIHQGDLILTGNATMVIKDSTFKVTGSTILRDQATLILLNSTFETSNAFLYNQSRLIINFSTYSWWIFAYGESKIVLNNSTLVTGFIRQQIQLRDKSELYLFNSTSLTVLVHAYDRANVTVISCKPDVSIQTWTGSSYIKITNSSCSWLAVYELSKAEIQNSLLREVWVTNSLVADNCSINKLVYCHYDATVILKNCRVELLVDGLIYRDGDVSLEGEKIFIGNYSLGVKRINTFVNKTYYNLFLLGKGTCSLKNITHSIQRVISYGKKVIAANINNPNLSFDVNYGEISIKDSIFEGVYAIDNPAIEILRSEAQRIWFLGPIKSLKVFNSKIICSYAPAIQGSTSDANIIEIVASIIKAEYEFSYADISVARVDLLKLSNVQEVRLKGKNFKKMQVYDSQLTLFQVYVEYLYNNKNSSKIYLEKNATIEKVETMDINPPVIKSINQFPLLVTNKDTVIIKADVGDEETGILSVILRYSVNNVSASIKMSNIHIKQYSYDTQEYVGFIEKQDTGTTIDYFIEALDEYGNLARSLTYTFKVTESQEEIEYRKLLSKYENLLINYTSLKEICEELTSDYKGLQAAFNTLQDNYGKLYTDFNCLKSEYDRLTSEYEITTRQLEIIISELNTKTNLMYLFIITTIAFIASTIFLIMKKSSA